MCVVLPLYDTQNPKIAIKQLQTNQHLFCLLKDVLGFSLQWFSHGAGQYMVVSRN